MLAKLPVSSDEPISLFDSLKSDIEKLDNVIKEYRLNFPCYDRDGDQIDDDVIKTLKIEKQTILKTSWEFADDEIKWLELMLKHYGHYESGIKIELEYKLNEQSKIKLFCESKMPELKK